MEERKLADNGDLEAEMKMSVSASVPLPDEPVGPEDHAVEGEHQPPEVASTLVEEQPPETPSGPRPSCT